MTILDIFLTLLIWSTLGGLILVGIGILSEWARYCYGLELLNPIYIYKQLRVNYFGAFWVTLFVNALCPIASFCYWFYKLCTVGRK